MCWQYDVLRPKGEQDRRALVLLPDLTTADGTLKSAQQALRGLEWAGPLWKACHPFPQRGSSQNTGFPRGHCSVALSWGLFPARKGIWRVVLGVVFREFWRALEVKVSLIFDWTGPTAGVRPSPWIQHTGDHGQLLSPRATSWGSLDVPLLGSYQPAQVWPLSLHAFLQGIHFPNPNSHSQGWDKVWWKKQLAQAWSSLRCYWVSFHVPVGHSAFFENISFQIFCTIFNWVLFWGGGGVDMEL